MDGGVDDPQHRLPILDQSDGHRPIRVAGGESPRAVDGIDDPHPPALEPDRVVGRFLGQPGGVRQKGRQVVLQKRVHRDVGLGDGGAPFLEPCARGRFPAGAEEGSRNIAGLAGRVADGTKEIRAEGRRAMG